MGNNKRNNKKSKLMDVLKVRDFSEYPGLRHCSISDDSGEEYYHKILNHEFKKTYEKRDKLKLILDFTAGYAPSFLDEVFGNLVYDFGIEVVEKYLIIISEEEPDLKEMIHNETFPQWQARRQKEDKPKKTAKHEPWYRLVDSKIIETKE
jgi:phosphomannomutase